MSSLTKRILSAIIVVTILFLLYFFFAIKGLFAALTFIVLGSQIEFFQLTLSPYKKGAWVFFFFLTCIGVVLISIVNPNHLGVFISLAFLTLCASLLPNVNSDKHRDSLEGMSSRLLLGFIYVGVLPSFAFKLLLFEKGLNILLLCLCCVFSTDILAYFVGKSFGKHKLQEFISPKKTWEGAIGGLVGSILITTTIAKYYFPEIQSLYIASLAIATSFFSQIGDLFESMIKRKADVKDSGRIMPGHGGVLDRIDGVYFALPIFYFFFYFYTN